jgi:hypothetical protein
MGTLMAMERQPEVQATPLHTPEHGCRFIAGAATANRPGLRL